MIDAFVMVIRELSSEDNIIMTLSVAVRRLLSMKPYETVSTKVGRESSHGTKKAFEPTLKTRHLSGSAFCTGIIYRCA